MVLAHRTSDVVQFKHRIQDAIYTIYLDQGRLNIQQEPLYLSERFTTELERKRRVPPLKCYQIQCYKKLKYVLNMS